MWKKVNIKNILPLFVEDGAQLNYMVAEGVANVHAF